jgi:hypothetical protein
MSQIAATARNDLLSDAMTIISVQVDRAHLTRLAANPVKALAELIWNAVDADAKTVTTEFERNALGGIDLVKVSDDGHGMTPAEAERDFGTLGASWKQVAQRSKGDGRILHGRNGEGRWSAYGLGAAIKWQSVAAADGGLVRTTIKGSLEFSDQYELDSVPAPSGSTPGTVVEIGELAPSVSTLDSARARERLVAEFALYLGNYPVSITVDGEALDPARFLSRRHDETIELPNDLGSAELTIFEWSREFERDIVMCDADGFALGDAPARFHAPGRHFTVYLRWDGFRDRIDRLDVPELDADLAAVLGVAREEARLYFKARDEELEIETVEQWKSEGVYPYEDEPKDDVEVVTRAIFDRVAVTAAAAVNVAETKGKKLSLRLISEALERDPSSLPKIIEEVLDLSEEQRSELAALLDRTSLANIVKAARLVTDRLDFLTSLEVLAYDPEARGVMKERSQLHKIIAQETWIFGEKYAMTANDESLTTILKRHIKMLDREELAPVVDPVTRLDGSTGIVDLMLSGVVPNVDKLLEHLVIELKAPKVDVGNKEIEQIKSYAHAVAADDRFASSEVRWEFWVVSSGVTEAANRERRQRGRPFGLVYEPDDAPIRVWVRTWGELIDDGRHRMRFFADSLKVQATHDDGLKLLQRKHSDLLPAALRAVG